MVALPADHVITDAAPQRATIKAAMRLARSERCLVTLGVVPNKAETGYGYIECGAPIQKGGREAFWVKRFHEKPSAAVAKRYLRGGKHLWNAGIFVGPVSLFRAALEQCAPRIFGPLAGVWGSPRGRAQRLRSAYKTVPSVSIDYAVMQPLSERTDAAARIAVVRSTGDWIDAGNWDAVGELWPRDAGGNSSRGRLLSIDSENSVVYSERLVALVGVKDLAVVDAGDAILICPRARAQEVRRVVAELGKRGFSSYI
jgi:mannose-1-phosphate guanylyltransferase/mannose-6-phosphate isomerase